MWALLLSRWDPVGFLKHSEWRYVVRLEISEHEGFRAVYYLVSIRDVYINAYVCSITDDSALFRLLQRSPAGFDR